MRSLLHDPPGPRLPAALGSPGVTFALVVALQACRAAGPPPPGPETPAAALEEALGQPRDVPQVDEAPLTPQPSDPPAEPPEAPPTVPDPDEGTRARANRLMAEGDFAAARALMDEELAGPYLETAAEALRAGRLEAALAATEEALQLAPTHAATRLVRGSAIVAHVERSGETQGYFEALETLRAAETCGPALARAARVARRLDRGDQALELARRGVELGEAGWEAAEAVASLAWPAVPAQRTLAEAALEAWRARGGAAAPEAQGLFDEAEESLALSLATRPDDPWAWRTLGAAYIEARRPGEARTAMERGLDRLPADRELYELLARAARELGDARAVLRIFKRQQGRRGRTALAWWYPGVELFRDGLTRGDTAHASFRDSEKLFRACRARDATLEAACLRYEALARTGRAWLYLEQGRLDDALRYFESAEQVVPGGLEYEVEGRLASASEGVQRVLDLQLEREELARAAAAASLLFRHAPGDERLARQAGSLQRDLGDRLQLEARDFELAARRRLDDPARLEELRREIGIERPGDDLRGSGREEDLFRQRSDRRGRAARDAYRQSLEALRAVAELAPDDLRAACAAAAVAVQRLGTDLEWAERTLLACVERGEEQLATGEFADSERRMELEEAWGDAHQLLGVLYLERYDDPARALPWFERCLEIGPLPRPEVLEHYLPRCR